MELAKLTLVTSGRPGRRRELGGLVSRTIKVSGTGKDKLRMTHLTAL